MSFKPNSRDRSVENTSSADDGAAEYLGQISFELLRKYFDKKFKTQNKSREAKLHSDARPIEKNLKLSKPEREIDFKFKGNEIQHHFNIKVVEDWKT